VSAVATTAVLLTWPKVLDGSRFLEWLDKQRPIKRNPLDFVRRPRRIAAEDLDVTSVSTTDVPKLLAACDTWPERIAVAILAYLGPRRNAVALLRLSDYELNPALDELGRITGRPRIRFREKGSKVIWKPRPARTRHDP
jgi:integrase